MAVTIKDIARYCKVGVATVSRAINNTGYVQTDLKKHILARVKELDWSPSNSATTLKTGKSNTVAIIIPDFTHYITRWMLHHLTQRLTPMGYQILVHPSAKGSGINELVKQRIEVAIILDYFSSEEKDDNIRSLIKHDVKTIGIFGKESFFPMAFSDHGKSAYEAADIILKAGHKKIGLVVSELTYVTETSPEKNVFDGIKKAMNEYNLSFSHKKDVIAGNEESITRSLKSNAFSAYVVFTVGSQMKFYICSRKLGIKIPDHVSMVGLEGDSFFPALNPPPVHFIHDYSSFSDIVEDFILSKGKRSNKQYSIPFIYVSGESVRKTGDLNERKKNKL